MANVEMVVRHHLEEKTAEIIGDHQVPLNMAKGANELSAHIDAKLRVLSSISPAPRIFKVHEFLRNVNAKAYEPCILAIGPYHRGKNQLSAMEEHKLRYLKQLLERKGENNANKYVSVMWQLKERARACYVDSVDLKDDEFVEMMLLDACFILEFLSKSAQTIPIEGGDPILKGGWISFNLVRDLLLVENQLPLFVLQKLFDMIKMSNEESLCDIIFEFFTDEGLREGPVPNDSVLYSNEHLLGLLHMDWRHRHLKTESENLAEQNDRSFISSWFNSSSQMVNNWIFNNHNWISKWFCFLCSKNDSGNLTEEDDAMFGIPCATQLREEGIKFKKIKSDKLLDLKFKNGIMEIPTLLIDDNSESLFRNLIAYEQFYQESAMYYFTDYIRLVDCLVNTSKDVELLRRYGIFENALGDDEVVANMFNRLCDSVAFSHRKECKYKKIVQEVNQHCSRRWNQWKANLRHNYFNTPWALTSFFAALLLLLLTVAQTVFSVLAYIKQK